MAKRLPVIQSDPVPTALVAEWPDAVLALTRDERVRRVRRGSDSVMLADTVDGKTQLRGFVRAVLRVPLAHALGSVFGVFVEVDRQSYATLRQAFTQKTTTQVWGKLATRLPHLEDAFDARVLVEETGGDARARVVDSDSDVLKRGPVVGPRS